MATQTDEKTGSPGAGEVHSAGFAYSILPRAPVILVGPSIIPAKALGMLSIPSHGPLQAATGPGPGTTIAHQIIAGIVNVPNTRFTWLSLRPEYGARESVFPRHPPAARTPRSVARAGLRGAPQPGASTYDHRTLGAGYGIRRTRTGSRVAAATAGPTDAATRHSRLSTLTAIGNPGSGNRPRREPR